MTDMDKTDQELKAYFAAGRRDTPLPSGDLMARIEADALALLPTPAGLPERQPSRGLFGGLMEMLGGWPAVSGLVAATAAGVWIGVSPPDSVVNSVSDLLGQGAGLVSSGALDPMSGFEFALAEG